MTLERAAMIAGARQGFYCRLLRQSADFLAGIAGRQFADPRDRASAERFSSQLDEMATHVAETFVDRAVEREAMKQAIAAYPNADAMRDLLREAYGNA